MRDHGLPRNPRPAGNPGRGGCCDGLRRTAFRTFSVGDARRGGIPARGGRHAAVDALFAHRSPASDPRRTSRTAGGRGCAGAHGTARDAFQLGTLYRDVREGPGGKRRGDSASRTGAPAAASFARPDRDRRCGLPAMVQPRDVAAAPRTAGHPRI